MLTSSSTHELLRRIAEAIPDVGACAIDARGDVVWQTAGAPRWQQTEHGPQVLLAARQRAVHQTLPGGEELVATFAEGAHPALEPFLRVMLQTLARCEQLEQDMDSMNHSSLQLLEQVAMLGETLPKLSAAGSEAEIARTGLLACVTATGVERAIYLQTHPKSGLAEVLVHVEVDGHGRTVVRPYPLEDIVPLQDGLIAEVLADGESAVLRSYDDGAARPEPMAPESLARRDVLGVPVTSDDGDRRQVLGVILLCDKLEGGYAAQRARLGSEERQVAVSFASMLGAVIGARKTAEFGKELSMAQAIQAQILPERPAAVTGFDLAGDYRTSGDVGGDYFDYVQLADGRTLAVIADVSGHNLASGMMMVSARATLRTLAAVRSDPAQLFEDLAQTMFQDLMRTERFITAAGVALSADSHSVQVVNAGHNDLMLYRAAFGTVSRLRADSTVFGFLPNATYESVAFELQPGDCLLLYTDGVTEAVDAGDEMFGEERLCQVLARAAVGTARQVIDAVLAAVQDFRKPGERGDDITVVAIKVPADAGREKRQ
ncbi:MAG: PP2C family protein-serine/threonine phosphatase [Planctomycetota bacterium]